MSCSACNNPQISAPGSYLSPGVYLHDYNVNNIENTSSPATPIPSFDPFANSSSISTVGDINGISFFPNIPVPFFSTYFNSFQDTAWWYRLADDTGNSPTGREQSIISMNNRLAAIKAAGFNTINFYLPDIDGYQSKYGGSFSYDPVNRPKPQFAVAQEIAARIAAANGLKVIFTIGLNNYRISSDGHTTWNGLADQYGSVTNPPGAYQFIQSLIDPTHFYGVQQTTKLMSTIGIPDGNTTSFIGDTRVIGWQFFAEWNPDFYTPDTDIETQQLVFNRYWNYFYSLVHANNINTAFAGSYLGGSMTPNSALTYQKIKAIKQWFAPNTGIIKPDFFAFECYGGSTLDTSTDYNLLDTYSDLTTLLGAWTNIDPAYHGDYVYPANRVYFGEGNCQRANTSSMNYYFQGLHQLIHDNQMAGINYWVSDSLTLNFANATNGLPANTYIANGIYDLFESSFERTGQVSGYQNGLEATNTVPQIGWHYYSGNGTFANPDDYLISIAEPLPSPYGIATYTGTSNVGQWASEAINNHINEKNLMFYADPNPINFSDGPNTTLYWDVKMSQVISTTIVDSSNNIIVNGSTQGNVSIAISDVATSVYYLINTTNNANSILSQCTLRVFTS